MLIDIIASVITPLVIPIVISAVCLILLKYLFSNEPFDLILEVEAFSSIMPIFSPWNL